MNGGLGQPPWRNQVSARSGGDATVAELQLSGVLDVTSAGDVRDAVNKILAAQPEVLLIDLGRLRVHDHSSTIFLALARQAVGWPGCELILCHADAPTMAKFRALGITRFMTTAATLAVGRQVAVGRSWPHRLSDRFQPVPDSVTVARRRTLQACQRWQVDELADAAQLIVTELVANAVEHARTPMELGLHWLAPQLHIAVRDQSTERPHVGGGAYGRSRGLVLVEAFATAWGHAEIPTGKVVWATVTRSRRRTA